MCLLSLASLYRLESCKRLRILKRGAISNVQFQTAWSGVGLTEKQASDMLDAVLQDWENGLTAALGGDDIPLSSERAALISQLYNLSGPSAGSINANIPSEAALITGTPVDLAEAYLQRAEIWWEIAVNSNGGSSRSVGIQRRRFEEADMFDLYADPNDFSAVEQIDEAKFIFRFLAAKEAAGDLIDRLLQIGNEVQDFVEAAYAPALALLENTFAFGQNIADYNHVFVDDGGDASFDATNINQQGENHLIFMEGGDDTIIGSSGNDYIDGGNGHDILDYSGASGAVIVNMSGKVKGADGNDRIANIEEVIGSDFGDFMAGTSGSNVLTGGLGNDIIKGKGGTDVLFGGDGDDKLIGGVNNDMIFGGIGIDVVSTGAGFDTIFRR